MSRNRQNKVRRKLNAEGYAKDVAGTLAELNKAIDRFEARDDSAWKSMLHNLRTLMHPTVADRLMTDFGVGEPMLYASRRPEATGKITFAAWNLITNPRQPGGVNYAFSNWLTAPALFFPVKGHLETFSWTDFVNDWSDVSSSHLTGFEYAFSDVAMPFQVAGLPLRDFLLRQVAISVESAYQVLMHRLPGVPVARTLRSPGPEAFEVDGVFGLVETAADGEEMRRIVVQGPVPSLGIMMQ